MRFVTIRPGGRFGNHVIMYMAAMAIAERLGDATICGLGFAQWNIPCTPEPDMPPTLDILLPDHFDLDALAAAVRERSAFNIVLSMHMQKIDQLLDVAACRRLFPVIHHDVPVFDDRYLLISIRTGDILDGHIHEFHWYPLMPIGFYQDLVAKTGKLPVFVGELDECSYVNELRAAFPDAIFVPHQSPMRDFDIIRMAKNIVVAISTFSWVASWLSNATKIYLPLNGFYNPAHMRGINLAPVDDPRYEFYLFPLNYAMSELEGLRLHAKMRGRWRQISPAMLRVLLSQPARIPVGGEAALDEHWYLSEYIDAAMDISEGWHANPGAHYLDLGQKMGYLPFAPLVTAPVPALPNLARGKPATQSSVSEWSLMPSCEADAAGAVDGDYTKDYGFHTQAEPDPWWLVDLQCLASLLEIHVYNRAGLYRIRARAAPLVLLCSVDKQVWKQLLRTANGELFGAERGPLRWVGAAPVMARYVKVMLESERQYLHLAQVAVFGVPQ